MFKKLMDAIKKVSAPGLGRTHYIDCMPFSVPVKSGPADERPFFAIPVAVTVKKSLRGHQMEKEKGKAMLTFFQRYSNDTGFWVEVGSHAGAFAGSFAITGGGFHKDVEVWLEPELLKVLKGETVTIDVPAKYHGWETYQVTLTLLKGKDIPRSRKVPSYMKRNDGVELG